jgi:hypothetical protein
LGGIYLDRRITVILISSLFIGGIILQNAPILSVRISDETYDIVELWKRDDNRCPPRPYLDENNVYHLIFGEDNISHINDAIEFLKETGGTLFIHRGDYFTGRVSIEINKPLNLYGENQETVSYLVH